jgi:hypothetical protein
LKLTAFTKQWVSGGILSEDMSLSHPDRRSDSYDEYFANSRHLIHTHSALPVEATTFVVVMFTAFVDDQHED